MIDIERQLEELQKELAVRNKILNDLSDKDDDEIPRQKSHIKSLQLNDADTGELRKILKSFRNQRV